MEDRFDIFHFENHYEGGEVVMREADRMIVLFETQDGYGKQVFPDEPDDLVCEQTLYHHNTLTVSCKGKFLKRSDVKIGIWTFYDENGELEREVDQDADYPVRWEQMLSVMEKNGISISKVKHIGRTISNSGIPQWVLRMESPKGVLDTNVFNAADGSLIEHTTFKLNVF